ncbi:MAG: response regulator [bacterium]|nr:response regulator [bacterium]
MAERPKILWIEDDVFLNTLILSKFAEREYQIFSAQDGKSAFEELGRNTPDIIVLDLLLPGMDGFEILEKIKADPRYKDIPVVVFSNLGPESGMERAKKLGALAYFVKADFDLEEVMTKIKKMIPPPTGV